MAAIIPGDIAAAGNYETVLIYDSDGVFSQLITVTDAGSVSGDTNSGPQTIVTGLTFRPPTNALYTTSTPSWNLPNVPHDCDWLPNDSGILVAVVPSAGVLQFKLYDFDGVVLDTWTPAVEPGFGRQHVKLSVSCDSDTVFYTSQQRRIQRFSLTSGQLTDYKVLTEGSPYLFGGIRVLPKPREVGDLKDVIVAMTKTGEGPRNAVCLDSENAADPNTGFFWHDIVNPATNYYVQKRDILTGSVVDLTKNVEADSGGLVDEILALACNFSFCPIGRRFIGFTTVIG